MLDSQLYYYGENSFSHDIHLPFGFKTDYGGSDLGFTGFMLLDTLEFVSIAKGTWRNFLLIDSVIKYGYRDHCLAAIVTDSIKQIYYIVYSFSSLHYQIYLDSDYIPHFQADNLTWIDVSDKELIQQLKNRRANYPIFFILSLIVLGFYLIVKWAKKYNNRDDNF
jgi:hypothetical protein